MGRPAPAARLRAGSRWGYCFAPAPRKAITMSLMRLIRNPLAVIAVLTAALALGGASAASATTHAAQTEPVNLYLYPGNGSFVPQVEPAKIVIPPTEPSSTNRARRFRRRTARPGRSTPAGPGAFTRPPPAWAGPASTGPR